MAVTVIQEKPSKDELEMLMRMSPSETDHDAAMEKLLTTLTSIEKTRVKDVDEIFDGLQAMSVKKTKTVKEHRKIRIGSKLLKTSDGVKGT